MRVAVLAGGCPSLDEIPRGECGNGVIEEELGDAAVYAGRTAFPRFSA